MRSTKEVKNWFHLFALEISKVLSIKNNKKFKGNLFSAINLRKNICLVGVTGHFNTVGWSIGISKFTL